MADRREFTAKTRKVALKLGRQKEFRRQFEAGIGEPRSQSANFKWLRTVVDGEWPSECVEWPFAKRANGYGTIIWKYRRTTAHRVVCELAHGAAPEPGMHAAHSCGNRACCNPTHLRWATVRENSADKHNQGTYRFGDACAASKLKADKVREIRALLTGKLSLATIGAMFGVCAGTIWDIKTGKTWRRVI